jgi:hypothetical protein
MVMTDMTGRYKVFRLGSYILSYADQKLLDKKFKWID